MNVLVVDDDEGIRGFLRAACELQDWTVHDVASGEECLERWRAIKPDVIVLDHMMPGLLGIDAAKALRHDGYSGPVFFFSAYLDTELATEAESLGLRPVNKIDTDALLRMLEAVETELDNGAAAEGADVLSR
jgi:CheY-like chemotaxis protein